MSIVVAAKLNDPASVRVLQYVLKQLAEPERSTIHLVVVIFQRSARTEERREAQDRVRQQFGTLLPKALTHRLHIVRLLTNGDEGADVSGFVARAICSKAAALKSDVIVVGGKARRSASGRVRHSAVAEGVRKYSRRPVLLMSDEHPLLWQSLPAIAEGVEDQDDLSDEELSSQDLVTSPRASVQVPMQVPQPLQLLASIGQANSIAAGPAAHLAAVRGKAPASAAQASSLSVFAC